MKIVKFLLCVLGSLLTVMFMLIGVVVVQLSRQIPSTSEGEGGASLVVVVVIGLIMALTGFYATVHIWTEAYLPHARN